MAPDYKGSDQTAQKVSTFGQSSGMHRPAQPEELSPAYVFLAAPSCASSLTGVVLPVMGGVESKTRNQKTGNQR